MKTLLRALMFSLVASTAVAGPLQASFGAGVSGMPWGASIDHVVGIFPEGDHLFASSPGERAYWVRDNQEFLGVPRPAQGILYSFGLEADLVSVNIGFPAERREQLLGTLISTFGAYGRKEIVGKEQVYLWHPDQKVGLALRMSIEPKHGIVWLRIQGPNYKVKDG